MSDPLTWLQREQARNLVEEIVDRKLEAFRSKLELQRSERLFRIVMGGLFLLIIVLLTVQITLRIVGR